MNLRRTIRKLIKIHFISTLTVTVVYLSLGVYFGPSAITTDLAQKYQQTQAAVITITAHVAGPPTKPIITGSTSCLNGSPIISLLWGATVDTTNYTLYRNGEILSPSLIENSFQDSLTNNETAYTYKVIANGPLGNTASDETAIATSQCQTATPTPPVAPIPEFTLILVEGVNINSFISTPSTNKARPTFVVMTNTPNASVRLKVIISKKRVIKARLTANQNGYFAWRSPRKLKRGNKKKYVFYFSILDPTDPSKFRTVGVTVKMPKRKVKASELSKNFKISGLENRYIQYFNYLLPDEGPMLYLASFNSDIYQGRSLPLTIDSEDYSRKHFLNAAILNRDHQKIAEPKIKVDSSPPTLEIPYDVKPGQYILATTLNENGSSDTEEKLIEIKPAPPLITLGQNISIDRQKIMGSLSWIILFFTGGLIIFGFLLLLEWAGARRARWEISENQLKKRGLFS